MISFFDSAFSDSSPLSEKTHVLESICHYGGFKDTGPNSIEDITKKIKICLTSQPKRFEGLLLLKTFIDQSSSEVLQQNALSWAQMIFKTLQNPGENSENRQMAFKIIKVILRSLFNSPRLKREASVSVMPELLDILLESSVEDEWIVDTVDCLSTCMEYFPANCGRKKDDIEAFLILLLDQWENKTFRPLSECFCRLPACSVDSSEKAQHEMWMEQFKQFVNMLNAILNFLYNGVENGCGNLKISSKQLPPLPDNPMSAVFKLVYRFKAFGLCLSKMLTSPSCSKVVVPVDTLLSFIGRILSIAPTQMESDLLVYSSLPALYLTALTILESFILSLDQQLWPVCHFVSKLLTQAIKINYMKERSSKNPLCVVRRSAYQVLQLFTEKYEQSFADSHKEFLVDVMIGDMTLNMQPAHAVKLEKTPSASNPSEDAVDPNGIKTSVEALNALKVFVLHENLDQKCYEDIYYSVINTVVKTLERSSALEAPYYDENYRSALYSLLQTLCLCPRFYSNSCLPAAINLVTCGIIGDQSAVVRSKCQEVLSALQVSVSTFKEKFDSTPVKKTGAGDIIHNDRLAFGQDRGGGMGISQMMQHATNDDSVPSESFTEAEMVNGVLPAGAPINETPSQIVKNNKNFLNELSQEPVSSDNANIAAHSEENEEPVFYTNSNAYSPSDPEAEEEEEMDAEEEEEDEEEEDFKVSYENQNGFSSDEGISDEEEEEEEVSPKKRPNSPCIQSTEPSPKKMMLNNAEENQSDSDVTAMLQDFTPSSPDKEC